MSSFRTNQPSRYVVGPNGTRMIATPTVRNNVPANMKNLNTRLMASKNAWTANTSNMLNNIRSNWSRATRDQIIKFIMYGYYGAFHLVKFFDDEDAAKHIRQFHIEYSKISTRNIRNKSMINPEILWRRLQALTKKSLMTFARIVEW